MPRVVVYGLIILFALGLIPLALIAKDRVSPSTRPRLQIIPDMDSQPKFKTQKANSLFADGRAMRPPVPGTIARGERRDDELFDRGRHDGEWATVFPAPVTPDLLARGRERYGIFCAPCHGLSGHGDGMVARRAERLQEGTWTAPSSLHAEAVRARPVGEIFDTITGGIRTMPAHGSQIPPGDRWAIVAYVRALQRSQAASLADVPPQERATLP